MRFRLLRRKKPRVVLWIVTLCSIVGGYQYFEGTYVYIFSVE
jgi:hypothetical protein